MILGIDTGGTFTDCVAVIGHQLHVFKCPSTPHNPAESVLHSISMMSAHGSPTRLIHGTTVGTNALLERKGAKTVFLTTAGFKDILEIGRQNRAHLYDLNVQRPQPLVASVHCLEVTERIGAEGEILTPLALIDLPELPIDTEAVAIGLLFAYLNPIHEQRLATYYRDQGYVVSASHEVLPEYREYERFSTTVANAYLQPIMRRYLSHVASHLPKLPWRVIQSNGGSLSWEAAQQHPISNILSGPAGGAIGALELGRLLDCTRLLTFDMGGTSTDVSLIDHQLMMTTETVISGLPLKVPMIAIHTVGAGGGSIARLDSGRALRVGPASAGAVPGPMCYGQGEHLTVTDAQVFLGRLHPAFFLGGEMKLQVAPLQAAFDTLGKAMNCSAQAAALGVISVANANMERALRLVSVAQGVDPSEFTLFCFGGAGGVHACELAQQLNIPKVLIPNHAGAFSALGMLFADVVRDYSLTVLGQISLEMLSDSFVGWQQLKTQAQQDFAADGLQISSLQLLPEVDLRYAGQSFELTIPWTPHCRTDFHQQHQQRYGYSRPSHPVELVQIRLRAVVPQPHPPWPRQPTQPDWTPAKALVWQQPVGFDDGEHNTPFYRWEQLAPAASLQGPAVIVAATSTVLLLPHWNLSVDDYLNLHLEFST